MPIRKTFQTKKLFSKKLCIYFVPMKELKEEIKGVIGRTEQRLETKEELTQMHISEGNTTKAREIQIERIKIAKALEVIKEIL